MKKIKAAGAICYRHVDVSSVQNLLFNENGFNKLLEHTQILLVHRPRYQDWSFPKGKLDKNEKFEAAAVREVHEEAGIPIALDLPIGHINYSLEGIRDLRVATRKSVQYYIAHEITLDSESLLARDEVKPASKKEIDDVRWLTIDEAKQLLTYRDDIKILDKFIVELKHLKLSHPKIPLHSTMVPLMIDLKRKKFDKIDKAQSKIIKKQISDFLSAIDINLIVFSVKSENSKKLKDMQKTVSRYVKLTNCETIIAKHVDRDSVLLNSYDFNKIRAVILK